MRIAALFVAASLAACSRPAAAPAGNTTTVIPSDVAARSDATGTPTPTPVTDAASAPSADAIAALPAAQRFEAAIVPFDDATLAHVRAVYAEGQRAGLRNNVFSKLGDSITESGSFLKDVGHGWYELGPWTRLEPTIAYFRRYSFGDAENNSFTRSSVSATAGWTVRALLAADGVVPVERELDATRAAFAILMIGTNDAERSTVEAYERDLRDVVDRVEARHVVLVMSTIPDQLSSAEAGARGLAINGVIRRVANERRLPLLEFWAALQGLPHQGIDPDNVHPSVYTTGSGNASAAVFTDAALRFGYNVRNLTALLMLERLRQTLSL